MENKKIQWHPAFDAALQIELAEDADNLIFESEHLLGRKPMFVTIIPVKCCNIFTDSEVSLLKNIQREFIT